MAIPPEIEQLNAEIRDARFRCAEQVIVLRRLAADTSVAERQLEAYYLEVGYLNAKRDRLLAETRRERV